MALNFPNNPTTNQTYQSGSSSTYLWNGDYWEITAPSTQVFVTATSASFAESASYAVTSSHSISASFATTADILTTRPTLEFRRSLLGTLPLSTDLPIGWDISDVNTLNSRLSYNGANARFTNISGRTLTLQVDYQACAVSQNGGINLLEHNVYIVKVDTRIATFAALPVGALFNIGRVNTVITLAPNEFFICYQYVTATGSTTWQTSDVYFGYTQGHSTRLKVTEI